MRAAQMMGQRARAQNRRDQLRFRHSGTNRLHATNGSGPVATDGQTAAEVGQLEEGEHGFQRVTIEPRNGRHVIGTLLIDLGRLALLVIDRIGSSVEMQWPPLLAGQ